MSEDYIEKLEAENLELREKILHYQEEYEHPKVAKTKRMWAMETHSVGSLSYRLYFSVYQAFDALKSSLDYSLNYDALMFNERSIIIKRHLISSNLKESPQNEDIVLVKINTKRKIEYARYTTTFDNSVNICIFRAVGDIEEELGIKMEWVKSPTGPDLPPT